MIETLGIRVEAEQVKLLCPHGTELSVTDVAGKLVVLSDDAILGVIGVHLFLVLGN